MLKQFKIIILARTCFGSRRNHHQGAVLCLAKTTKCFCVLVGIYADNVMAAYQPVVHQLEQYKCFWYYLCMVQTWRFKCEYSGMRRMQKIIRVSVMTSLVGLYVVIIMWQLCQLLSLCTVPNTSSYSKADTSNFHSHLQTSLHIFRVASVSCSKSCATCEFHKVAMSISGCKVRADNFIHQNKLDPLYKGVVVSAAAWLGRAMRGRWEADRGPFV